MRLNQYSLLLTLLAVFVRPLVAQTLDPTFAPTYAALDASYVRATLQQPDGKIIVGGSGAFLDGVRTSKLRRLNADGSPDAAFLAQTGSGPDAAHGLRVESLALQADGKILVGGFGTVYYDGWFVPGLVRLNANGSLDHSFNAGGTGFSPADNLWVTALAVQADGKIVVATNLTSRYSTSSVPAGLTYNGQDVANLFRLNANGSLDMSFAAGTGVGLGAGPGVVNSLLVQADGKIVVGGNFDTYSSSPANGLLRLNTNGTVDATFRSRTTFVGTTYSVVQQPDGRLVVAGSFSNISGNNPFNLARLNSNGTPDGSFSPGQATIQVGSSTGTNNLITKVKLQADGSLLVAGRFNRYNGAVRGGLARVSSAGVLDAVFAPGTGINPGTAQGIAYDLQPLAAGQYLASGQFTQYDGTACTGLARLDATGARDASYAPLHENGGSVRAVVPLAGGQLLVQGNFARFNGASAGSSGICTLNANGTLASAFSTSVPNNNIILASTGQLFATNSAASGLTVTRLLPTGTADAGFAPPTLTFGANPARLTQLVAVPGGGYLLTGAFSQVNGVARPGAARLLANGALDPAFAPTVTPWQQYEYSLQIKALANGQVLVQWADAGRSHLVRLNANGTPDPSLNLGSGPAPNGYFTAVPLPNGGILVASAGAPFTSFNGTATPRGVVRLRPNGAPDPGFVPAVAVQRPVLQADGRVSGVQLAYTVNSHLVRLNADGTLDASFPALPVPESIYSGSGLDNCVFQPDGKIILYGGFVTVDGQIRTGLARLSNRLLATQPASALARPGLELFPNPAQGQVTVRLPAGAKPAPAQLFDLQGRLLRSWPATLQPAAGTTLALTGLKAGVYVLRMGQYAQRLTVND